MSDEVDFESPVEAGFSFEKTIKLTEEEISAFAKLSGDFNPLHHNEEIAKTSRLAELSQVDRRVAHYLWLQSPHILLRDLLLWE